MGRRLDAMCSGLAEISDGVGDVPCHEVNYALEAVIDFYEAQMPPEGSVVISADQIRSYSTVRFDNEHRMTAWFNQHRECVPISFAIDPQGRIVALFYKVTT